MTSNIDSLHQQAISALNQQDYPLAHQLLLSILQQDKYYADAYFLLGMIASIHHNVLKAIDLIQQAHKLDTHNIEYIAHLAKQYAVSYQPILAAKTLAKLPEALSNASALTLDTIGVAYSQLGLHHKAIPFFQQAVACSPKNSKFQFNFAASLKFIGDSSKAQQAYEQAIRSEPTFYKAYYGRTTVSKLSKDNNHIEQLSAIFEQLTQANDKLQIGHALAKELEALQDYDASFNALIAAKKAKLASLNYTLEDDKALFKAITNANQHQEHSPRPQTDSNTNAEAIFIVGMPRTGTTLVERILSHHSDVTSVGELQNFGLLFKQMSKSSSQRVIDPETINRAHHIDVNALGQAYIESTRALTGKTAKFVDKMPLNFFYVPYILQALPKAKIVCLDRQPLDTIMSNFKQLFSVNQSYYHYALDLKWTTEFYLMFKELTALWQQLFPQNFYLMNYENLVENAEYEAKKLIEFTGLHWQAQCLDIDKNNSPVATASALQVREPINNKKVAYWKHFDKHLQAAKTRLKLA